MGFVCNSQKGEFPNIFFTLNDVRTEPPYIITKQDLQSHTFRFKADYSGAELYAAPLSYSVELYLKLMTKLILTENRVLYFAWSDVVWSSYEFNVIHDDVMLCKAVIETVRNGVCFLWWLTCILS